MDQVITANGIFFRLIDVPGNGNCLYHSLIQSNKFGHQTIDCYKWIYSIKRKFYYYKTMTSQYISNICIGLSEIMSPHLLRSIVKSKKKMGSGVTYWI